MQCKAIAKSTNSRCRASVKAQSEYCDAHVPKEVVKNDSVSSAEEIPSLQVTAPVIEELGYFSSFLSYFKFW